MGFSFVSPSALPTTRGANSPSGIVGNPRGRSSSTLGQSIRSALAPKIWAFTRQRESARLVWCMQTWSLLVGLLMVDRIEQVLESYIAQLRRSSELMEAGRLRTHENHRDTTEQSI